MNGYSKSSTIYLSDLQPFSQTPKPIEKTSPNHTSKTQETKQMRTTNEYPPDQLENEDGNGVRFGVILGKKYSSAVSSSSSTASSHRFRLDNKQQGTTPPLALQSAVKRVFSMRRSSSVSEGYCRIHDQCATLSSSFDDGDDGSEGMYNNNAMQTRSVKKKKKKQHRTGKILKACKRIFGL
ncbi:hypothetical protein LOK49_LG02G02800 [Camellia lanceoleosa]|uniref:Uncharacterized protein n=1 Tax=Camellia lanceoleosa TaxID=1840588 RepID=A0ACC0IHR0_9ERIC|nr:hypothetical protein LOK49_LG02G02800 [Camellia lanceoleosa]